VAGVWAAASAWRSAVADKTQPSLRRPRYQGASDLRVLPSVGRQCTRTRSLENRGLKSLGRSTTGTCPHRPSTCNQTSARCSTKGSASDLNGVTPSSAPNGRFCGWCWWEPTIAMPRSRGFGTEVARPSHPESGRLCPQHKRPSAIDGPASPYSSLVSATQCVVHLSGELARASASAPAMPSRTGTRTHPPR